MKPKFIVKVIFFETLWIFILYKMAGANELSEFILSPKIIRREKRDLFYQKNQFNYSIWCQCTILAFIWSTPVLYCSKHCVLISLSYRFGLAVVFNIFKQTIINLKKVKKILNQPFYVPKKRCRIGKRVKKDRTRIEDTGGFKE